MLESVETVALLVDRLIPSGLESSEDGRHGSRVVVSVNLVL